MAIVGSSTIIIGTLVRNGFGIDDVSPGTPTVGELVCPHFVQLLRPGRMLVRHVDAIFVLGKPTLEIDRLDGRLVRRIIDREPCWAIVGPLFIGCITARFFQYKPQVLIAHPEDAWTILRVQLGQFDGFGFRNPTVVVAGHWRGLLCCRRNYCFRSRREIPAQL